MGGCSLRGIRRRFSIPACACKVRQPVPSKCFGSCSALERRHSSVGSAAQRWPFLSMRADATDDGLDPYECE
eukprot:12734281-Heterocapsa_arctica.AAC.1